MFESANRSRPSFARRQSHRTTRRTPSRSTGFQPVSSQNSQGIKKTFFGEVLPTNEVYQRRVAGDRSDSDVEEGEFVRTRSVGDDLTSAVDNRCSQSPMPRASSCLTYSMNSFTSPCIRSILRRMLRMI